MSQRHRKRFPIEESYGRAMTLALQPGLAFRMRAQCITMTTTVLLTACCSLGNSKKK